MIDRHDEKNLTGENYKNCRVQQEVSNEKLLGITLGDAFDINDKCFTAELHCSLIFNKNKGFILEMKGN
jgi:hypothetical protein